MIDSELARIDASPAAAAAALLQVAREFNGRLELTECLTRVCAITQATFRADRSSIMLWSERKRGFIATADVGTPPDVFARSNRRTFSMQGSPYLDQLASGEVVVIDRSNPEPMAQRLLSHLQVATQVVAPLTGQHGFVGALLVSYERSVHLGREQLDLVRGIAQQAAVAIESARLFTNTQKAAAFRTALSDLALDLNREPDLARMRARVCEGAQAMFAVDGAVLAVGDGDHLSVCAVAGVCGSAMIGQRAPQDACGTLAEVLRQRRAAYVNRIGAASGCQLPILAATPMQALLAIPLISEHTIPSVLVLIDTREPDRFGAVHVDEAMTLAATVTAWMENRRLLLDLADERAKLAERSLRLQEVNATLTLRSEQLRSANGALEELIYVASHDLRSPLINLGGFACELTDAVERLRGQLNGTSQDTLDDVDEAAGIIRNSATRLDALVQGLLDVSRCGTRPIVFDRVDVQALVQTILDAQRFVISSAAVDVQVGALPVVTADPMGLSQVFANLIDNAIKYMGGSAVRRLEIGYREGALHRFFVRDSGPGIGAADQDKIFRLFQRGSRPPAAPGEGIGLAVVRKIVERHGGSVEVESEAGNGATFWITLPFEPPPQVEEVPDRAVP